MAQPLQMHGISSRPSLERFVPEATLQRPLLLFALLSVGFWFPMPTCPNSQLWGDGDVDDRPVAWRRTEHGWEDADRWHLNSPIQPHPTRSAAVHPFVIASLVLLISLGALVIGSPRRCGFRR